MTVSAYLAKYRTKTYDQPPPVTQPAPAASPAEVPPPSVWHVLGVLTELGDLEGLNVEFLHGGGVVLSVHDAPVDSIRRLLTRLGIDPIGGRLGPLSTAHGSWLSFHRGDAYSGGIDVLWFCADPPAALDELLDIPAVTP
jgi:hypothetical protein